MLRGHAPSHTLCFQRIAPVAAGPGVTLSTQNHRPYLWPLVFGAVVAISPQPVTHAQSLRRSSDRGVASAEAAAALLAPELGWDADETAAEVAAWHHRVEAERAANDAPDDDHADALRRAVVDARGLRDD